MAVVYCRSTRYGAGCGHATTAHTFDSPNPGCCCCAGRHNDPQHAVGCQECRGRFSAETLTNLDAWAAEQSHPITGARSAEPNGGKYSAVTRRDPGIDYRGRGG